VAWPPGPGCRAADHGHDRRAGSDRIGHPGPDRGPVTCRSAVTAAIATPTC